MSTAATTSGPLAEYLEMFTPKPRARKPAAPPPAPASLDAFKAAERERIVAALTSCHGHREKAAKAAGLPRRTFYRRLKEYGIQMRQPVPRPRSLDPGERARILEALARCDWNLTKAARDIGMDRRTLGRRLEEHGLTRAEDPAPRTP